MRLELQAEKGDTQVIYDGHTVTIYDAASNTLYRYTPSPPRAPAEHQRQDRWPAHDAERREDRRSDRQAAASTRTSPKRRRPTSAGQPAYTVRVSPKEGGSLLGGAELSFDAANGAPAARRDLLLDQLLRR